MRILLIGEYSNVHWTLAQGLRTLGHDVLVVSDGDSWKNYQRDIDISRRSTNIFDTLQYLRLLKKTIRKFKSFDVVQIINPMFLELRAHRILPYYKFLRENNDKLFMGAYGMDYYWVKTCLDCKTFKYQTSGTGNADFKNIKGEQLEFICTSKSDVTATVDADYLKAATNNGVITLNGKAKQKQLSASKDELIKDNTTR